MKKVYLSIAIVVLLISVMNFHFLPKILHEILGLALFTATAVHLYWNRRALASTNKFFLLIDALLIVAIITVTATGICISNHLFNGLIDMHIQRNITIHQLHVSIPFAMIILIGLHLGHNWAGFYQRFKRSFNLNIAPTVEKILVSAFCAIGIVGVYMDQFFDRLLMKHIFATPATQLPLGIYFVLMFGMLALFTAIGFFVDRLIKKF